MATTKNPRRGSGKAGLVGLPALVADGYVPNSPDHGLGILKQRVDAYVGDASPATGDRVLVELREHLERCYPGRTFE